MDPPDVTELYDSPTGASGTQNSDDIGGLRSALRRNGLLLRALLADLVLFGFGVAMFAAFESELTNVFAAIFVAMAVMLATVGLFVVALTRGRAWLDDRSAAA